MSNNNNKSAGGGGGMRFGSSGNSVAVAAPLDSFSPLTQQYLLMRDLLQVLSGVEGQYIRVAAAAGATAAAALSNGQSAGASDASVAESAYKKRSGGGGGGTTGAGIGAALLPKVSEATFLIDLDTADRSAANQVQLVNCCL